jgi:hypothetical protein
MRWMAGVCIYKRMQEAVAKFAAGRVLAEQERPLRETVCCARQYKMEMELDGWWTSKGVDGDKRG